MESCVCVAAAVCGQNGQGQGTKTIKDSLSWWHRDSALCTKEGLNINQLEEGCNERRSKPSSVATLTPSNSFWYWMMCCLQTTCPTQQGFHLQPLSSLGASLCSSPPLVLCSSLLTLEDCDGSALIYRLLLTVSVVWKVLLRFARCTIILGTDAVKTSLTETEALGSKTWQYRHQE